MIVSHSRQFVFVAIPKTASQTVRELLNPLLTSTDWRQETMYAKHTFPIPSLAQIGHGHLRVSDVLPYVENWESYFSFAVVRHPVDRFISTAYFRQQRNPRFLESPLKYLLTLIRSPVVQTDTWYQPQYRFVYTTNGELAVSKCIRFEYLERELSNVWENCSGRKLDTAIPVRNTSSHPPYKTFYEHPELIDLIHDRYRYDFDYFNYER